MKPRMITDEVQQFIRAHIDSVEQLEVLLLLRHEPQLAWSAEQVSRRLRTSPLSASARLQNLQAQCLIQMADQNNGTTFYCYSPQSQTTEAAIGQLQRAYVERKDTIIHLIFSTQTGNIQHFS